MSTTGDLVTLAGGAAARVYAVGSVPANPTYPYRVIGYSPNAPTVRTANQQGDPARRFYVQHFARGIAALEAVAEATRTVFDGQAVDGDMCVQEVVSPVTRDPDDQGVLSTTHTFRF